MPPPIPAPDKPSTAIGSTDLDELLRTASPSLMPGDFVLVAVPDEKTAGSLAPIGMFREAECVTVFCRREQAAAAALRFDGVFRQITLTVHSSLHAVGFLAAISRALAAEKIPCNVVSAVYHDHLFIPESQAEDAMRVLRELCADAISRTQLARVPAGKDTQQVQIRPAISADAHALAQLSGELGYPSDPGAISQRLAAMDPARDLVLAADYAGTVVGWLHAHHSVSLESGARVEIVGLVIGKSARRLGAGRKLVGAAEAWARQLRVPAIVVRSNTQRTESHVFYRALGYTKTKTQAVYQKVVAPGDAGLVS